MGYKEFRLIREVPFSLFLNTLYFQKHTKKVTTQVGPCDPE